MIKDKNEEDRINLKNCIAGVIGFALYFIMSYSAYVPLAIAKIDPDTLNINVKQIYLIIYSGFTIFLFFYLFKEILKKDWIDFKKNYKTYFKKYIKVWLIALGIMYASNVLIVTLKFFTTGQTTVAANEETIRQTLTVAPFYTFFAATIYAPFIEELTFRKSLRNIFSNDIAFIIISAFVFGGMHVFTSGMSWFDLLYLIPYCTPGAAFAYILVKSKNIFNSMSIHFIHNSVLMILQIILLLRGLL